MIKVGNYFSLGDVIGRGSFGKVFIGLDKKTRTSVAIKELDLDLLAKQNPKLMLHLQNEISIMREIQHPNVVCLLECKTIRRSVYLVLEYCGLGDFQSFLQKQPMRKIPEDKALYFMKQFAEGLKVLRSKDIIHRDLKPENLLLCEGPSKDEPILKIADFGFARHIDSNKLAQTLCGSPLHMAPEILANQSYSVKSDLWSVGTIMYQMLFGVPIFQCSNFAQLFHAAKYQPIIIPNTISPLARDLLLSLLERDPNLRISWDEFFNHPYFVELPSNHDIKLDPILEIPQNQFEFSANNNANYVNNNQEDKNRVNENNNNDEDISVHAYPINEDAIDDQIPSPVDSLASSPASSPNNSFSDDLPKDNSADKINDNANNANSNNNVSEVKISRGENQQVEKQSPNNNKKNLVSISQVLDDFVYVQRYSEIDEIMQKVEEIKENLGKCKTLETLAEDYKMNQDNSVALSLYYKSLQMLQESWIVAKEIVHFVDNSDSLYSFLTQTLNSIQKLYISLLESTEELSLECIFPTGIVDKIIYDSAVRYCIRGFKEETQKQNFGVSMECYKFALSLLIILKSNYSSQSVEKFINSVQSRINYLVIDK